MFHENKRRILVFISIISALVLFGLCFIVMRYLKKYKNDSDSINSYDNIVKGASTVFEPFENKVGNLYQANTILNTTINEQSETALQKKKINIFTVEASLSESKNGLKLNNSIVKNLHLNSIDQNEVKNVDNLKRKASNEDIMKNNITYSDNQINEFNLITENMLQNARESIFDPSVLASSFKELTYNKKKIKWKEKDLIKLKVQLRKKKVNQKIRNLCKRIKAYNEDIYKSNLLNRCNVTTFFSQDSINNKNYKSFTKKGKVLQAYGITNNSNVYINKFEASKPVINVDFNCHKDTKVEHLISDDIFANINGLHMDNNSENYIMLASLKPNNNAVELLEIDRSYDHKSASRPDSTFKTIDDRLQLFVNDNKLVSILKKNNRSSVNFRLDLNTMKEYSVSDNERSQQESSEDNNHIEIHEKNAENTLDFDLEGSSASSDSIYLAEKIDSVTIHEKETMKKENTNFDDADWDLNGTNKSNLGKKYHKNAIDEVEIKGIEPTDYAENLSLYENINTADIEDRYEKNLNNGSKNCKKNIYDCESTNLLQKETENMLQDEIQDEDASDKKTSIKQESTEYIEDLLSQKKTKPTDSHAKCSDDLNKEKNNEEIEKECINYEDMKPMHLDTTHHASFKDDSEVKELESSNRIILNKSQNSSDKADIDKDFNEDAVVKREKALIENDEMAYNDLSQNKSKITDHNLEFDKDAIHEIQITTKIDNIKKCIIDPNITNMNEEFKEGITNDNKIKKNATHEPMQEDYIPKNSIGTPEWNDNTRTAVINEIIRLQRKFYGNEKKLSIEDSLNPKLYNLNREVSLNEQVTKENEPLGNYKHKTLLNLQHDLKLPKSTAEASSSNTLKNDCNTDYQKKIEALKTNPFDIEFKRKNHDINHVATRTERRMKTDKFTSLNVLQNFELHNNDIIDQEKINVDNFESKSELISMIYNDKNLIINDVECNNKQSGKSGNNIQKESGSNATANKEIHPFIASGVTNINQKFVKKVVKNSKDNRGFEDISDRFNIIENSYGQQEINDGLNKKHKRSFLKKLKGKKACNSMEELLLPDKDTNLVCDKKQNKKNVLTKILNKTKKIMKKN